MYKLGDFVVFVSYLCLSQGLVIDKDCPKNIESVDNFDLKAFGTGVWHEIARYPNEFQTTNCGSIEFLPQGDKIKTKSKLPEDSPNYYETVFGIAPGAENKGELQHEVSMGNPPVKKQAREYILAVDYDKYYIGYECTYDEKTKKASEYAWVLTRSKDVSSDVKAAVDNYIKSSKIVDASKFHWLDLQDKSC